MRNDGWIDWCIGGYYLLIASLGGAETKRQSVRKDDVFIVGQSFVSQDVVQEEGVWETD